MGWERKRLKGSLGPRSSPAPRSFGAHRLLGWLRESSTGLKSWCVILGGIYPIPILGNPPRGLARGIVRAQNIRAQKVRAPIIRARKVCARNVRAPMIRAQNIPVPIFRTRTIPGRRWGQGNPSSTKYPCTNGSSTNNHCTEYPDPKGSRWYKILNFEYKILYHTTARNHWLFGLHPGIPV